MVYKWCSYMRKPVCFIHLCHLYRVHSFIWLTFCAQFMLTTGVLFDYLMRTHKIKKWSSEATNIFIMSELVWVYHNNVCTCVSVREIWCSGCKNGKFKVSCLFWNFVRNGDWFWYTHRSFSPKIIIRAVLSSQAREFIMLRPS